MFMEHLPYARHMMREAYQLPFLCNEMVSIWLIHKPFQITQV